MKSRMIRPESEQSEREPNGGASAYDAQGGVGNCYPDFVRSEQEYSVMIFLTALLYAPAGGLLSRATGCASLLRRTP